MTITLTSSTICYRQRSSSCALLTKVFFPPQVSLDSRVRDLINRNMLEPSKHSFDDAQLQIYTLMHRDSYPRFMNSEMYKDLVESFSQKSAEA